MATKNLAKKPTRRRDRKNRGIFKGAFCRDRCKSRIQPDESHKSDAGEPRQRRMF